MGFRHEIVLAGIGGSGVVWAGTLLARVGSRHYPWVTRFPNFTTSMRGGPCECMVIFSTEKISSSLVAQGDVLIVLDSSQLLPFANRLRPGGWLLAEKMGLPPQFETIDARRLAVPALEMASSMGDMRLSNLIVVGVYLGAAGTIPVELVEKELGARFGITETGIARSSEAQSRLQQNLEAFRLGLNWAKEQRQE